MTEIYGLLVRKPPQFRGHAHEMGHLPIWKEVKFIDRDPHWYTRRVKEVIHMTSS